LLGNIFISHARRDDQAEPRAIGANGLVTSLHNQLLADFGALGPLRPTIFRDIRESSVADHFEPRLRQALTEAKVFLLVLSSSWLDSPRCRHELEFFLACWRQRSEAEKSLNERIFLVRTHNVLASDRLAPLQRHSSYDLMSVDPDNKEEFEYFDVVLGRPRDERWYTCVRRLAQDLRTRLCGLGGELSADAEPEPNSPPRVTERSESTVAVYVARPAIDMEQSCATLVDELSRRGYRIVPDPDQPLPAERDAAVEAIDAALGESVVSVHLLGDKLGFRPENAAPIVRLQLERAANKVNAYFAENASDSATVPRRFRRLIWAPRVAPEQPDDADVREPLAVLAKHTRPAVGAAPGAALQAADQLVADTLPEFSQFVLAHLEESFGPTAPCTRVAPGAQVYVQHDEGDAVVAGQVADGLQRLGFAPVLPLMQGSADERWRVHSDYLQTAEAVLLCWAYGSPVWVRAAASELHRWQDLGRSKAFASRTVIVLPPQIEAKARLCTLPAGAEIDRIIDATTAPPVRPYVLELFLQQL